MPVFWFIVAGVLLGMFLLFEGYEWGTRIVYGFYASNDNERRQVFKSVQSVWSANEIWFLAFLGVVYWVFPAFFEWLREFLAPLFYIVIFLYVLVVVLNNLIRVFWDRPFRRWLDILLLVAQSGMVLLFGLMIAIWLRGWDGDKPRLWSEGFSPFGGMSGYLDWFTVLFTLFFFIVIVLEGLGWTVHKVSPALARKLKFAIQRLAIYGLILYLLLVISLFWLHKDLLHYYFVYPAWIILPILTVSAFAGLMAIRTYAKNNKGYFLATNLFIYFWLGLMVLKYPYLIRSVSGKGGINIFQTEFHDLAAYNGHWWVVAVALLLLVYSVLIHKYYKGKSLRESLGESPA